MRRVYKYPLLITDEFAIGLPKGAQILRIALQHGEPFLWALVDPDAELEQVFIRCAGTGHPIEEKDVEYLGSVSMLNDNFIAHYFKIKR